MKKYGFIYIWFDKKYKRYYVGRHWGTIDDGYVCSSRMMRQSYNRRKEDFKRRIVSRVYTSNHDLVLEEQRWLDMIKPEEIGLRYYNKTLRSDSPSTFGYKHREETKKKISDSRIGQKPSEYNKIKRLEACLGRKQSTEEKEKRASKLRGLKRTEEFKLRMKKPKQKVTCPHCEKVGGLASMTRWHFDNCNKYINQSRILEF